MLSTTFSTDDGIQLVDLPDELILMIMNRVQPKVLLLCSIIGLGHSRLEKLAFSMCQSIELTCDSTQSPNQLLIPRFYTHVLPCITKKIQSLAISTEHMRNLITFAQKYGHGTLANLTHLKIRIPRETSLTGKSLTLGIERMMRKSLHFSEKRKE